jgi:hypothetical protein
MKKILISILIILSFSAVKAQYVIQPLLGLTSGGRPGSIYTDTLKPLSLQHPLIKINDTTAGMDTANYYITSILPNGTNDSLITLFAGGRRIASKIPTSGGGSTLSRQVITSGSSATVTGGNYIVTFDPSSTLSTFNLTLPSAPSDLSVVEIEAGGTITSGAVVTSLTITGTKIQSVPVTTINAGEYIKYRYRASITTWYREN